MVHKYKLTYFTETAGRSHKSIEIESELTASSFVNKIRGLRDTGGQGALPGIEDVWLGMILVERPADAYLYLIGVSGQQRSMQELFDQCLGAADACADPDLKDRSEAIDTEFRSIARHHGLKFNEMAVCPGCSEAGNAGMPVHHREPLCTKD